MSFFWPDYAEPEPDVLGRLGRVMHWGSIIVGAIPLAVTAVVVVTGSADWEDAGWVSAFDGFCFSVGALIGRGLRYILAGE